MDLLGVVLFVRENMNYVAVAASIASAAHAGMSDRAGVDYFAGHVCHVASAVAAHGDPFIACALLHDVVEDCGVSAASLIDAGIPAAVVSAVVAISKVPGESSAVYLDRVKSDPIARIVKLADLAHNMDLSRLPVVGAADLARHAKYVDSVAFLMG